MRNSLQIIILLLLIISGCSSSRNLNSETGFTEKLRRNTLFLKQNKKYKQIEKIYDGDILVAIRTSTCLYTCEFTQPISRKIVYLDANGNVKKQVEYVHLNTEFNKIVYQMIEFDENKNMLDNLKDTISLSDNLINIKKEFLYLK